MMVLTQVLTCLCRLKLGAKDSKVASHLALNIGFDECPTTQPKCGRALRQTPLFNRELLGGNSSNPTLFLDTLSRTWCFLMSPGAMLGGT